MPADENIGTVLVESCPNPIGIASRPTPDVRHPDSAPAALEMLVLRKAPAQELVVDIPVYGHQRLDLRNGVGHGKRPDVTGVPDFVTGVEVMQDAVIDVAMSVAEQSDAHRSNFVQVARLSPSWRFKETSRSCALPFSC